MCNCVSVLVYLCIYVLVYLWCGNRVEVRTSVGENKRTGMPHYGLATEWKPRPTLCHAPRIHCCLLRSQLSLTCQHVPPETVTCTLSPCHLQPVTPTIQHLSHLSLLTAVHLSPKHQSPVTKQQSPVTPISRHHFCHFSQFNLTFCHTNLSHVCVILVTRHLSWNSGVAFSRRFDDGALLPSDHTSCSIFCPCCRRNLEQSGTFLHSAFSIWQQSSSRVAGWSEAINN